MINFEKFTNYSQEIIFAANAKKDFYKNTEVQPEHIVMAMIEDKGIAKDYLEEFLEIRMICTTKCMSKD